MIILILAVLAVVTVLYVCLCRRAFRKLVNTPACNSVGTAQQSDRVVIVGAGVSGIAAAKTFVQYGYKGMGIAF